MGPSFRPSVRNPTLCINGMSWQTQPRFKCLGATCGLWQLHGKVPPRHNSLKAGHADAHKHPRSLRPDEATAPPISAASQPWSAFSHSRFALLTLNFSSVEPWGCLCLGTTPLGLPQAAAGASGQCLVTAEQHSSACRGPSLHGRSR